MSDDLSARLRRQDVITFPGQSFTLENVMPWLKRNRNLQLEAADRIEALEAQLAAMRDPAGLTVAYLAGAASVKGESNE